MSKTENTTISCPTSSNNKKTQTHLCDPKYKLINVLLDSLYTILYVPHLWPIDLALAVYFALLFFDKLVNKQPCRFHEPLPDPDLP